MFVLPVSDHVGLVLGLEQAPGFRTHDYLIGTLSVHVEVKSLLGLLSVGDLDFPSFGCELAAAGVGFAGPHLFHCHRGSWGDASGEGFSEEECKESVVEPSDVPPSLHKSGEVAWGKEGTAGHLALELDFRHPGALQLVYFVSL